jgi:hypothetical protein
VGLDYILSKSIFLLFLLFFFLRKKNFHKIFTKFFLPFKHNNSSLSLSMVKQQHTSTRISQSLLKELVKYIEESLVVSKKEGRGRCWRLRLKPNGRGYPEFKYNNIRYLAHRIMACKKRDGTLIKYPVYDPATKIQASHRCGFSWCCNNTHLVFENDLYNQTRDCCHRVGINIRGYFCPHSPRCTYNKGVPKHRRVGTGVLVPPTLLNIRRYNIKYIGRTFCLGLKKKNNNNK